ADGVQDGGEPGIENVTVTLYDSGDNEIDTTTTDTDGLYLFEDVTPGDYYVVFTLPTDYVFSPQDDTGATDATDSDADTTTGATITTDLDPGEDDLTWDAGMYQLASFGDLVWDDLNADGVQDGGEPGIENVTVTLYDGDDNQIDDTTTDSNGNYLFEDLEPGDYYVVFTLPTDYVFSPQDNTGATDATDSDADTTTGTTIDTTLISGENDLTWDAGMYQFASIGDYVWHDTNANGIQDGGEPGLQGVTVTLYDGGNNEIDTTTTDADGLYLFEDLVPGDYYVDFAPLTDYNISPQDAGADDTVDSDADPATGQTATTDLTSGESDLTWDAGMYQYASVGDYVWHDTNANGVQDGGEPGLQGVTVTLYDSGDNEIDTTTTDADGLYLFEDVVPGDYYIVFTPLTDYNISPQDAGADDTIDSDADTTTDATTTITLSSNEEDLTWDAGMYQYASLGDRVWSDTNDNGIQDGGEPGVENVTVTLYDGDDNEIDTTTTDGTGLYLFEDLVPGDYYVEFTLPDGYVFSRQDEGADDTVDSDADRTDGTTEVTTLVSGENDLTWDAGIMQVASLGDYVWDDLNADGVQDGGEPGIENVTVTLYDSGDNEIDTTTTDGDGLYLFEDVVPGDYYVVFTLPTDYVFSPQDDTGATDATDSDADTTTGATIDTTLLPGENDLTWDAGMYQYASLGDRVWEDTNDNGIQDGGENGYSGVTVTLYDGDDNEIDTTTTDGDGLYLFDDLVPGDYYVVFTLPTDYVFSRLDEGADDTADSDADRTTGSTTVTTLVSGENDLTWDAGIMAVASLGDRVWEDLNDNGIQDGGEPGVENVTVTLYDGDDNEIDSTTTDADGNYLFDDLVPGDYYVIFSDLPVDYVFSRLDEGADDTVDSDADRTTGATTVTTLLPGEDDLTWDVGIMETASLGDFVWDDLNDNGIQDGGEPGVTGITVTLYDGDDNEIDTTATDGTGSYLFEDLVPGDYYVIFSDLPVDYVFSRLDEGADDTVDSDADRTTGATTVTTLLPGENDLTWDAGIMETASLGDRAWNDLNDNGIQDGGEPGVQNVTVTLYDGDDNEIDTTATDGVGNYLFDDLVPGDYYVIFSDLPVGYVFSRLDEGADDTVDSDADRTTGVTTVTTLLPGENDLTWDAGIMQVASLGDYVWEDLNDNGVQDGGEPGVENVTVTLYDGDDNEIDTTTTDGDGLYLFEDLVPGDYYVVFTLPTDYVFSRLDEGADDTADSDADRTTGATVVTNLLPGENDLTWDAGIMQVASIGDTVWEDLNDNGIQDGGEDGYPGVTVTLYDSDDNEIDTTTTDGDGLYLFDDLVPGDYYVVFTLPDGYVFSRLNEGADDTVDSDADRDTGTTETITLTSGENDLTWDAGIMAVASIGDRVWLDTNANGEQDDGEDGYPGVTVTLYDGDDNEIDTATTDGDGLYLFDDLVPGDYYLIFTLPADREFSPQNATGVDAADDSDADITTGTTVDTTLLPGENDLTWDAGIYQLASIGNFVWDDLNADGIQDTGEIGVPGVTVNLLDNTLTQINTTTTDANGFYSFIVLVPSEYTIEFELPTGYIFSPQDTGADDTADSDADTTTGRAAETTLISGENDLTWDAGIYQLASIGDTVWEDLNADGVQDAGELGIEGVTVNLLDDSLTEIDTTTTDINGNYSFVDLVPGEYAIEFELLVDYYFSPQDTGADDAADSDADRTTGRTITTMLVSGEDDPTWDAGIYRLIGIGDTVWLDSNADGLQDPDEEGVADVLVTLRSGVGAVLDTMTTDEDGFYQFIDLVPGDYTVEFELPVGYVFTEQDAGNNALDSDANTDTGRTIVTDLISDEYDPTWDAGLLLQAAIGDTVWEDINYNGIQDDGEPGVAGVTVNLYAGGGIISTATTDSDGNYGFIHLNAGEYQVEFILPDGYTFTKLDQGADDAEDSDADVDTGMTELTQLFWGETDPTWDAGIVLLGTLGDRVWLDTNRNGEQESNERGIGNVTLTLVLPDGTQQTDVTDEDGFYLFEQLPPGSYNVTVDLNTLPPGLTATYDLDGGLDSTATTPLGSGETLLTVDFGYAPVIIVDGVTGTEWVAPNACQRVCVDWMLYHSNQTGDWEIFRLGDLSGSISPNLSQGEDADDMAPTRSPNAEWIVFSSNRDGNWELYLAPADGDGSDIRRLTYNTIALDTDPAWGPNNFVVFETTRNGNWDLYLLDMSTGRTRQLTDSPTSDLNAFWSPDGSKLIFQSDRSGQWQIYELDLATLNTTLLSDGEGNDTDPQYDNSGARIAFRTDRYSESDNSVVTIMNADGSSPRPVSDPEGDATNHSWSPDDSLIAYQSDLDGDLDVYVYETGSGQTRQLTDNDIDDYAPTWQCGTNHVVFTSDVNGNPDIFDADPLPISAPAIVVDETAEQLTFDQADDIYPEGAPTEENASREGRLPDLTETSGAQTSFLLPDVATTEPDTSLETGEDWQPINSCPVACVAWSLYHSDRSGSWDIFRLGDINANISQSSGDDLEPSRSPDAGWVAFTSDRDGSREIYITAANGTQQQRVTFNDATDSDPVWSPNSQSIVYESDRDGNWNLYLFDVFTGQETQLTNDPADDLNAAWSSAGGSLFFQSNRSGSWQIYRLNLSDGTVSQLTDLPGNAYEPLASATGSLIAFRYEESDGQSVLYLMQEDGTDLQAISDPAGRASNQNWYYNDTLLAYQSDLDGDLDIYVYEIASGQTRQLTDNTIADYAPSWQCGEANLLFTSEATGNAQIFEALALPLDAAALDVETEATQLTTGSATNRYPVGTPSEENASRAE
ncbi:MAG: hypothetical protein CL610_28380, partial [Anaerolineaceae bacterium]|nr:hypothetical protein [Anaerolineaceae bacterium]